MILDWLFDASGFSSKQTCGPGWSTWLLAAYGVGNLIAFLIYTAFPLILFKVLVPRHLRAVKPALYSLVLFIISCGWTHLAEMLTIWWPAYRLVTLIHLMNAATSTTGLILLIVAIRRIRFVPIRSELENELAEVRDTLKDIQHSANELAITSGSAAAIGKLREAIAALRSVA